MLNLFQKIACGTPIRIVAFGSSSTQRFMCGMHWFDYVELGFKNVHSHKVGQFINAGVSDDSTEHLLARFDTECALYRPDLVLLTIGANDCRLRHPLEQFEGNLYKLRESILALGAELVLQTFYPIDVENAAGRWPDLDDYVQRVRDFAAATSTPLIDTAARWRPLRDRNLPLYRTLLRDFAHLNERGNMLLGMDVMRFFQVGLVMKDGQIDYCRDAIALQYLVDSFHREPLRQPPPASATPLPAEVINAVGYATRVCGSRPAPEVQRAMQWAQERFFEFDDLLDYASKTIAHATGAEAGLVTCSASAGLTLGVAAILAGDNLAIMDALPDTAGLARSRFLYPQPGAYDYDHPVRAAGARLTAFNFAADGLEERLQAEFTDDFAGVVLVWKHRDDHAVICRVAAACRRAGVPLLLDAAMALPPVENLTELARLGASLVVLSGGKHLGGPQNSGLLFGDAALIRSAWLQMVDLDVRPGSWSLQPLLDQGVLPHPPRHGIGRGFKVGKDALIGCIAALERYTSRDFAREYAEWEARCRRIAGALANIPGFICESLPLNPTGQYPVVQLQAPDTARMIRLKQDLKVERPAIILAEDETRADIAWIYPMCLNAVETTILIARLAAAMQA